MITVRTRLLDLLGFLRFVLKRWTEDRCPQIAGSLTFTTLLALVPVFAIAVALLSRLPFFEDVMVQIKVFLLLNLAPEIAGKIITVYMVQFRHNAGRLTTIGVVFLFITAVALMFTVDRSLNGIWRVRNARPLWISMMSYLVLLTIGPALIAVSVSITTYLLALSTSVDVPRQAHSVLLQAVPASVSAIAFFLLYRLVPNRRVSWKHAAAGGIMAAVAFELAKEIFAFYMTHAPAYSVVYGTFAAVPFFLLWIYLSWLVVLFGAELTASLDYWPGKKWKRVVNRQARFGDAVAVARMLFEAQGKSVTFERLRRGTGMPQDELEDALHHMTASGLVVREGRTGYAIPESPPPETA
ncbi:MAG: YihY family inner membrane protein [Usitatibacter sp.]